MSISLPTSPPRPITTLFPYTTLFRSGLNRFEAWTRDDDWVNKWYVKSGFKNVDSYLQVFVDSDELVGIMKSNLTHFQPTQAFAHYLGDETEKIKKQFKRTHECVCFEKMLK